MTWGTQIPAAVGSRAKLRGLHVGDLRRAAGGFPPMGLLPRPWAKASESVGAVRPPGREGSGAGGFAFPSGQHLQKPEALNSASRGR